MSSGFYRLVKRRQIRSVLSDSLSLVARLVARLAGSESEAGESTLAHAGETAEAKHAAPVITPEKGDRRFSAPEWQQLPFFDYLKQAYLLNSRWLAEVVGAQRRRRDQPDEQERQLDARPARLAAG